jgi:hypothetical protein
MGNQSPPAEFPANREKNREKLVFGPVLTEAQVEKVAGGARHRVGLARGLGKASADF